MGTSPRTGSPSQVQTRPHDAAPAAYLREHGAPVLGIALVAVLARLPFLTLQPSNDEGGFLVVAAQWRPRHGQSLYGHYWVDRPPLLLDFFVLADRLGGLVALRCLGLVVVLASVLLAGLVGHLAAGPHVEVRARRRTVLGAAVVAAVFLCQPSFGTAEINGELIATPLVLGGFALVLAAARTTALRRGLALMAGAGGCAAAAVLVKQNELDVVFFVVVAAVTLLRRGVMGPWRALVAAAGGAVAVVVVVLVEAAERGTRMSALWNAVVTFRFHASRVIAGSPSEVTGERLESLLRALLLSGLPLLVAAWLTRASRAPRPGSLTLRAAVPVVLAWEGVAVAAGGSYWHHYLICLVPGAVLAHVAWSTTPPSATWLNHRTRWVAWPGVATAYVTVTAVVMLTLAYAGLGGRVQDPTAAWLRDRAHRHDTLVVAFGHPEYHYQTGMRSPYPELWSLPVRVRDPRLHQLREVLASPHRPDWIVTGPEGLAGWGIDTRGVDPLLRAHYREVGDLGERKVFLLADENRPPRS